MSSSVLLSSVYLKVLRRRVEADSSFEVRVVRLGVGVLRGISFVGWRILSVCG